jgi:hypothetical protein
MIKEFLFINDVTLIEERAVRGLVVNDWVVLGLSMEGPDTSLESAKAIELLRASVCLVTHLYI